MTNLKEKKLHFQRERKMTENKGEKVGDYNLPFERITYPRLIPTLSPSILHF